MRFIGDVHGKFDNYKKIITNCNESIQIGDMGVGFKQMWGDYVVYSGYPPTESMIKKGTNHRFIRGNHDNPEYCRSHSQYIKDGTIEDDMMLIGGAWSIDYSYRTEGLNWWRDEELSYEELKTLIFLYEKVKPRIMITHDAPLGIPFELNIPSMFGNKVIPTRTGEALKIMFEIHQPEIWIFGHWHQSADKIVSGTRFICLAELEYIDLEI